jgi:deoxycytidylate deaminase
LSLVVHAEVHALLHASAHVPSGPGRGKGSHTLYLHGAFPCGSCAKLLAQSGSIKEVRS